MFAAARRSAGRNAPHFRPRNPQPDLGESQRVEGANLSSLIPFRLKEQAWGLALLSGGSLEVGEDLEIREVCQKIMGHSEESPFGAFHDRIKKLNLWEYFKVAKERGYDFQLKGDKVILANEFDHLSQ